MTLAWASSGTGAKGSCMEHQHFLQFEGPSEILPAQSAGLFNACGFGAPTPHSRRAFPHDPRREAGSASEAFRTDGSLEAAVKQIMHIGMPLVNIGPIQVEAPLKVGSPEPGRGSAARLSQHCGADRQWTKFQPMSQRNCQLLRRRRFRRRLRRRPKRNVQPARRRMFRRRPRRRPQRIFQLMRRQRFRRRLRRRPRRNFQLMRRRMFRQ